MLCGVDDLFFITKTAVRNVSTRFILPVTSLALANEEEEEISSVYLFSHVAALLSSDNVCDVMFVMRFCFPVYTDRPAT